MTDSRQPLPAEAAGLGELQAEYRSSGFQFFILVLWGSVALAFGLAILAHVGLAFLSYQPGNAPGRQRPPFEILLVIGAGVTYVGVYVLRNAWLRRGGRVLVLTEGLVQVWGGRALAVGWEEIVRIWRREEPGPSVLPDRCYLRLELVNGQDLYFANNGLMIPCLVLPPARLTAFRTDIERETNLRKLPGLLETLEAGRTLAFDHFTVSQDGVSWQGQTYLWEQIFHLEVGHTGFLRSGQLRWALVLLGGKQVRFRMDEIPNLALLWALIEIVRAESFAPRKEWHSQPRQATPHAADAHDHLGPGDGSGVSPAQESGPVTDL
jgi:hypothetical protein